MEVFLICSIHIDRRAFTETNHNEAINEKEMFFHHITSRLKRELFLKDLLLAFWLQRWALRSESKIFKISY